MAKRSILPPEALSADTQAFFDVLNKEQDFAVVVVSAAYIDACLGSLLHKRLLRSSVTEKLLDPRSGALGSFGARADAAYSLGLVSKAMYQDLLVLGEIRNTFAHHHLSLSFANPELAKHCDRLAYAYSLKNGDLDEPMFQSGQLTETRTKYVITVVLMSQRLLLTALGTKHAEAAA